MASRTHFPLVSSFLTIGALMEIHSLCLWEWSIAIWSPLSEANARILSSPPLPGKPVFKQHPLPSASTQRQPFLTSQTCWWPLHQGLSLKNFPKAFLRNSQQVDFPVKYTVILACILPLRLLITSHMVCHLYLIYCGPSFLLSSPKAISIAYYKCLMGSLGCGSIPGSGRSPGRGHGNPLQHSCAWWILWTEEPGRQQSTGLQRVRHNWADLVHTHGALTRMFQKS